MSGPLFTFESKFPDGSPRRFAGTWRPTFDDARPIYDSMEYEDRINAMKGNEAPSFLHLNWQSGVLDRPIYYVEEFERA